VSQRRLSPLLYHISLSMVAALPASSVCRTQTTTGIIIGITTAIGTGTITAGIITIEIV
jgi:hypothetical protein